MVPTPTFGQSSCQDPAEVMHERAYYYSTMMIRGASLNIFTDKQRSSAKETCPLERPSQEPKASCKKSKRSPHDIYITDGPKRGQDSNDP